MFGAELRKISSLLLVVRINTALSVFIASPQKLRMCLSHVTETQQREKPKLKKNNESTRPVYDK